MAVRMPQRMTRLALYELVWSGPLTVLGPQFAISDVALKNICRRFDIPVPRRGYWAKLRAGKPWIGGREAREISITVHQTRVDLSLDRPPAGRRKAAQAAFGADQLRFAILAGHVHDERASWQDGEGGRLERFIQEIAVEVVTSAEFSYRERCVHEFEWRAQRKATLEEDARNRELQIEREAQEHRERVEQARIDRLLDEALSLRQAMDIRAYVEAVRTAVANETTSISAEELLQWSKWALAAADRIDPVRSARFIRAFEN
jgi:hypothetical protein